MPAKSTRSSARGTIHAVRFPGESPAYRKARNKLLKSEIELRAKVEAVAALRRELPLGGVAKDYEFEEMTDGGTTRRVRLSELFTRPDASLVVYSYMYGPAMKRPCPMCTSILDAMNASAPHVTQRVNLVVVARSPIERILEFTRQRGWRNLRLLSSAGNTYNRDYRGETTEGAQMPALNVFVRHGGKIRHFTNSELMFAPPAKGQHPRHVDMVWPLWNLFDLTPEGRGTGWGPKLEYPT
jgi:predicted dithiol-disulfide oxidoreductase (DUF899 family)